MFQYRNVLNDTFAVRALEDEIERKENAEDEILKAIQKQIKEMGSAFEEMKSVNVDRWKEIDKKKAADVVIEEKLAKLNADVDKFAEAKADLEKKLAVEKKEREALELRLSQAGTVEENEKAATELKSFNDSAAALAAQRSVAFTPLDAAGLASYKNAFNAAMRKDARQLTTDEIKILSVGSDPDGGYLVTPDVSGRIVMRVYETSEMRQIASAQTIGTDKLEGIEDLGEAGVGYAGEHVTSGNVDTPQIGKWAIPVFTIDTEPKSTQQLLDDASVDIEAWLSGKVAARFGRFENKEFCTGAVNIRGVFSYPTIDESGAGVAWGSIGAIKTGVNSDFAASTPADFLFDLVGLLKNEYAANGTWVTRRAVLTKIRKFKESTTNAYIWQPGLQQGQPERLLGYPVSRMEDVPALGVGSLSIAFGDFRSAYQIVDRQGIRVIRDGLTQKPYVKFYTTKRVGGGVINFEAYKIGRFAA